MNFLLQITFPNKLNVDLNDVSDSFWANLLIANVSGIFILLTGYLAYRFALKQLRKETYIQIERAKYTRFIEALENCWKLLSFMTTVENKEAVLFFIREKSTKDDTWFINQDNAKKYIEDLNAFFYKTGLGIYLPKSVKEPLYEYRGILYGFSLVNKNNAESNIKVENEKMRTRMAKIYEELNFALKTELDATSDEKRKKIFSKS
jgi:hypothetical protein